MIRMDPRKNTIIDSNCYLGSWPTRSIKAYDPAGLARLAEDNGVDLCLVSPIDAIFHKDIPSANRRFIEILYGREDRFVPVPIYNPLSPLGFTSDVDRVRLVPSYHRFSLGNRRCLHFLKDLESREGTLFLSMRMRDERLSHVLLDLKPIEVELLIRVLSRFPHLKAVVNNGRHGEIERILSGTGDNVLVGCAWSFPISFIEKMVDAHGDHRLVYGSNAPLHYYKSSLLQVLMADLSEKSRRKILGSNIRQL